MPETLFADSPQRYSRLLLGNTYTWRFSGLEGLGLSVLELVPMPRTRDWIDYALAVAPFLALLVAVSVGLTQAYLQRQNLKQQLFAKRFEVYRLVVEFLWYVGGSEKELDTDKHLEFYKTTAAARFLFGADVTLLITEVVEMASRASEEWEGLLLQQESDPDFKPEMLNAVRLCVKL